MMTSLTSNEEVTLYPMIPDPSNEGAVHMYTEQRLLAENLKVIVHCADSTKSNQCFQATLPPVDSITMAEILVCKYCSLGLTKSSNTFSRSNIRLLSKPGSVFHSVDQT